MHVLHTYFYEWPTLEGFKRAKCFVFNISSVRVKSLYDQNNQSHNA